MNKDIMFEVIPPSKNISDASFDRLIEKLADAINGIRNVGFLNIPEIVDENHLGIPYCRNMDARLIGLMLKEKCKKEIILNTVVGYFNPKGCFEEWLDECLGFGIDNFVFVGAKLNSIKYPGPSIIEANKIACGKKINFGNIFIPEREKESDRLISKTASGCNFFTSQVLFEPESAIYSIKEYESECLKNNLKPAKFYLSFSPLSNLEDIAFIKWLGAEISERTENRLKSAQDIGEESIKIIVETFSKISDFFNENSLKIPWGLNIEYITLHNLELAKKLVNHLEISSQL